jgi:hypothetical protein
MAAPLAAKAYLSTKPAEANVVGFVTTSEVVPSVVEKGGGSS